MLKLLAFHAVPDLLGLAVMMLPGQTGATLRRASYRRACKGFASGATIGLGVRVSNKQGFSIGSNSRLEDYCIVLNPAGELEMGSNSHLGVGCFVNVVKGRVVIGDNVAIGPGTHVLAYSNAVLPGMRTTKGRVQADIRIGHDVFVGAGVIILPGITIGDGSVIAAGAVVTRNVPPKTAVAGIPARELDHCATTLILRGQGSHSDAATGPNGPPTVARGQATAACSLQQKLDQ